MEGIINQVTCKFEESQYCILILSCNGRTNPRMNQCFGTEKVKLHTDITVSYDYELLMHIEKYNNLL